MAAEKFGFPAKGTKLSISEAKKFIRAKYMQYAQMVAAGSLQKDTLRSWVEEWYCEAKDQGFFS